MGNNCSEPASTSSMNHGQHNTTNINNSNFPNNNVNNNNNLPSESNHKNSLDIRLDAYKPNPEIGAFLSQVPLFIGKLTNDELNRLGGAMEPRNYRANDKIIIEGNDGDEFFVIFRGDAVVSCKKKNDNNEYVDNILAPLSRGDFFGESALLSNSKRMATVTATSDLECLCLSRSLFLRLFDGKRFKVHFAKRNAVAAEKQEQREQANDIVLHREKLDSVKRLLTSTMMNSVLFKNLDPEQLRDIVDEMHRHEVKAGTEIIKQGAVADNFYVVETGDFNVLVSQDGAPAKVIATRGPSTSFGELALLYNSPRAATVIATSDAVIWAIDRIPFRRILTKGSRKKLTEYESFLTQVNEFGALSSFERSKIAEALDEVSFPSNHVICKQGDAGDTFYIIKSGTVKITKTVDGVTEDIGVLKSGNYFGELALRNSEPRAATISTLEPVVCLCMDHHSFVTLMGPLDDIMKQREGNYVSQGPRSPRKEDEEKEQKFIKSELKVIGTLGKGSFGFVQLVKDSSNKYYALKGIAKSQIIQTGQIEHVISERRVMIQLNNYFLTRLYSTFKEPNAIYFLLEPCLGGELFTLLRARHSFPEPTAQFYAGCVVLAFEYMHSKNFVHRDLKPENLLLDDKGYIKLTDFGFAKHVTDRTFTLCGTPDYLAPEVVSGSGHGRGVDWWTLGILIYEMLASYPPFYDEDPMRTYAKIMHGQVSFPKHFSPAAVDLIKKLLNPKATKRLGVINGGAALIKEHPFFRGLNWDALARREIKAPIEVKIKSPEDLSNFDTFESSHEFPVYKVGKEDPNWDADF